VRLYTDARIDISRTVLERIAGRGRELRTEYTARYEQLRRLLLCLCVALVLAAFTLCGFVLLLAVG
jgi:uncharacterized membrane protein YqjE